MLHPPYDRNHFPWRDGNRFELLVDGASFFPAMLAAIGEARHHVLLEIYLFESGHVATRFIAAFTAAARRGVAVYLLVDDFGARGLSNRDRAQLREAGVTLTFYNPIRYGKLRRNLFRDHRKLLVVDGEIAFLGGAGLTDEFDPRPPASHPWHEVMIGVRGPVVLDWQQVFAQTWAAWVSTPLNLHIAPSDPLPGGGPGRVALSSGHGRMEIKRSLVKRVRGAERLVWIATAYFIPSWKIRRALSRAARQGVDVRLLLPGPHTDHPAVRHAGRRFYAGLLRHGVRIFEYQPRFLHAKVLLCDDWTSIGSSNIDRWNLRWNLEGNQEIGDQGFTEQVRALFEADFAASKECHYDTWRNRSRWARLKEWFWGKVDLWLERHGQGPNTR